MFCVLSSHAQEEEKDVEMEDEVEEEEEEDVEEMEADEEPPKVKLTPEEQRHGKHIQSAGVFDSLG